MYGKLILALAAAASAAPAKNANFKFVNGTGNAPFQPKSNPKILDNADAYTFYQGNGSPEAGWPTQDQWATWDELWATASSAMASTCGWNSVQPENSPDEIADVGRAIQQVAGETGVDERFILSIVMQESKGCVRIGGTENGVTNPGLMQSHNGQGTCAGVTPCPYDMIVLMIQDGTAGTADGDGLKQTHDAAVADLGGDSARAFYAAARKYNSGSVDYDDLNNRFTSTGCYATDVANRLTGWLLAESSCPLSP